MKNLKIKTPVFIIPFLVVFVLNVAGIDSTSVKKIFASPPREYANAPLWVWNDMMSEEQVHSTLRDLASQEVKQAFVHPRPGLMTPYLSAEWFRLWKVALDEAERLDMNIWIYDENSYPSGFAGGWVPELMPEARGRGLVFREESQLPRWNTNIVGIYQILSDGYKDITTDVLRGKEFPKGKYLVAQVQRAGNSPWHGNRCYVDLMYPGVTEKFLEVTHEAYRREIGKYFGKRVPGSFTDEPELRPAGGLPWTEDFNAQFRKRWGYDLIEHLPCLRSEVGNWQKVRHNYFQTQLDLFIERWARPYYEYCASNKLEFTGHYWEHEWPNCAGVPDNMAMAAWQQRPGIDILMNQYAEHTHAQFGNVRSCREISSIANQLGRARTLVELYGAGGWDLRFEDIKRIGDWLEVLGVNTLDEHLSYVTIRGARKRDHPQSFSYHEPWWNAYHIVAGYFKRVTSALVQGEQINRILVIEPTTTAWMYQGNGARLNEIGNGFFNFLMALESAQIEYDLGCEDVIARYGRVDGREFVVGKRSYHTIVLPPIMEPESKLNPPNQLNLNTKTLKLIDQFAGNGGNVLSCGSLPERVDGDVIPENLKPRSLISAAKIVTAEEAVKILKDKMSDLDIVIKREDGDRGILFHHRRILDDGNILFLVNTSIEYSSKGNVIAKFGGVEKWDPHTGKVLPYPFKKDGSRIIAEFELPPSGSLLLFFTKRELKPFSETEVVKNIKPQEGVEVKRLYPNVLTIDYVDISAGGESRSNVYFYRASQFAFQKNGMPRNPWDSAVQFKDEIISHRFPPESGFVVTYKFTIEDSVPADLSAVIEKPEIYQISCNGVPVKARKGEWWLDKSFGKISIAKYAKKGLNTITLRASPMTIFSEIEPIYILGSFSLRAVNSGFVICSDTPLRIAGGRGEVLHINNPDGTMWLSSGIGFSNNKASDDRAPFIIFDLGKNTNVRGIKIWNYNENHVKDLTGRGASKIKISASSSATAKEFDIDAGIFELKKAGGGKEPAQFLNVTINNAKYIRFDILANHNGVSYPATGDNLPDNGFAGLAEVQFISGENETIKGVTISRVSSELASHRRIARQLVDGSGFEDLMYGWDKQGHPFYAGGVAYKQKFIVNEIDGEYRVALGRWRGSVAEVKVNGKEAGYIGFPPWEKDVTPFIKKGLNEVEVIVIGTLKNTLGPHHGNPPLGSAWPSMFQRGPEPGPPPGDSYSTVSYGLFEPFDLKNVKKTVFQDFAKTNSRIRPLR